MGPRVQPLTSWCPCGEPLVGDRWTERAPSSRPPCSFLPSMGVSYLTPLQGEGPVLPSHSLLPTCNHGSHLAWKCHGLNLHHLEREPLVPMCMRASSLLGICVQRCLQREPPPTVCQATVHRCPCHRLWAARSERSEARSRRAWKRDVTRKPASRARPAHLGDTGMPRAQRQTATEWALTSCHFFSSGRWVVCRGRLPGTTRVVSDRCPLGRAHLLLCAVLMFPVKWPGTVIH